MIRGSQRRLWLGLKSSRFGLVPVRRGYDGLEGGQAFWIDEEADAASAARFAADEAFALEGERHLMDGGRSDGEEAPDVGFSGRPRASE